MSKNRRTFKNIIPKFFGGFLPSVKKVPSPKPQAKKGTLKNNPPAKPATVASSKLYVKPPLVKQANAPAKPALMKQSNTPAKPALMKQSSSKAQAKTPLAKQSAKEVKEAMKKATEKTRAQNKEKQQQKSLKEKLEKEKLKEFEIFTDELAKKTDLLKENPNPNPELFNRNLFDILPHDDAILVETEDKKLRHEKLRNLVNKQQGPRRMSNLYNKANLVIQDPTKGDSPGDSPGDSHSPSKDDDKFDDDMIAFLEKAKAKAKPLGPGGPGSGKPGPGGPGSNKTGGKSKKNKKNKSRKTRKSKK